MKAFTNKVVSISILVIFLMTDVLRAVPVAEFAREATLSTPMEAGQIATQVQNNFSKPKVKLLHLTLEEFRGWLKKKAAELAKYFPKRKLTQAEYIQDLLVGNVADGNWTAEYEEEFNRQIKEKIIDSTQNVTAEFEDEFNQLKTEIKKALEKAEGSWFSDFSVELDKVLPGITEGSSDTLLAEVSSILDSVNVYFLKPTNDLLDYFHFALPDNQLLVAEAHAGHAGTKGKTNQKNNIYIASPAFAKKNTF